MHGDSSLEGNRVLCILFGPPNLWFFLKDTKASFTIQIAPGEGQDTLPQVLAIVTKTLAKVDWLNLVAVWRALQIWKHAQDFHSSWDCSMEYGKIFRGGTVTLQRSHEMQDLLIRNRGWEATAWGPNPEQRLLLSILFYSNTARLILSLVSVYLKQWLPSTVQVSGCDRDWPQSHKYVLPGPSQERSSGPWHRIRSNKASHTRLLRMCSFSSYWAYFTENSYSYLRELMLVLGSVVEQVKYFLCHLPSPIVLAFPPCQRQKKTDHLCARHLIYTIIFPFYDNQWVK